MNFISKLFISSFAIIITAYFLDGVTIASNQYFKVEQPEINKFITAFIVAVVLGFLNTIIKPIITILSLPITIFTLGLFQLAINAFIILFAGKLVNGFKVDGFWTALWFSLILSLVNAFLELLNGKKEKEK